MTETQTDPLQRKRDWLAGLEPLPTIDELCQPFEDFLDGLDFAFAERLDTLGQLAYSIPGEYRAAADEAAQLYRAVVERVAIAADNHVVGDCRLPVVAAMRLVLDAVTQGFDLVATLAERDRLDREAGQS